MSRKAIKLAQFLPLVRVSKSLGHVKVSGARSTIAAKLAGLDIMTWTLERSGRIREDVLQSGNHHYYQTVLPALNNDGDILKVLDVLAKDVGVKGVFSDWPATTTFYANCTGL